MKITEGNSVIPKLNIVFIITGLSMGGAEKQVCLLADKMAESGNDITLISLGRHGQVYPSNRSITVYELGLKKNILSLIYTYQKLRKLVKRIQPDIVHSHMIHANIFARLLRVTLPMNCLISSAHSNNDGGLIRILAYRITDGLSNISTNVSQGAVDSFIRKRATKLGRMIPVHNGISLEEFCFSASARKTKRKQLGVDDNTKIVLSIGRLTEAKDFQNLLLSFSRLNIKEDIQLVIIGEGVLENELKELAIKLKINNRVHWLGLQYDISEWLSACDIFVLSSQWEGFGLVIAEAMACLRPVVATDVGGVKEVIGEPSLLVSASDPEALAKKINEVLNYNYVYQKNMIRAGRLRIENMFSINNLTQSWLSLYFEFCSKK